MDPIQFRGDVLPSSSRTSTTGIPPENDPSVFSSTHKYDTDKIKGKINAKELDIEDKVRTSLRTLEQIATKGFSSSAASQTINTLINMANALLDGLIEYNPTDVKSIDKVNADCEQRIADANSIAEVVKALKEDMNNGIAKFERTTFSSETVMKALGDETHNEKAQALQLEDSEAAKAQEIKNQMTEVFKQSITQAVENGVDFDLSALQAVNAKVKDIDIKVRVYAKANEFEGETRNEKGQQIIKKDAMKVVLTYTYNGKTDTLEQEVSAVPKGIDLEFIREDDKGIALEFIDENEIFD